jgi:hypothetical protein
VIELFEVKPGMKIPASVMPMMFPKSEDIFWFAKLYRLDAVQLARLLRKALPDDEMVQLLTEGDHSIELQDYLVEIGFDQYLEDGEVSFYDGPHPAAGILAELWESLEVTVATSIQEVADKVESVVGRMPGKQGHLLLEQLRVVNRQRPVVGDVRALVKHKQHADNLLILDVSGSMGEPLIKAIIDSVVGLGYMADLHLVIVSNTATHWEPGEYTSDVVLARAEFGGTQYETLAPLLQRDWGIVVTIADYDSSWSAKQALSGCTGSIQQVLDISVVNSPSFLAECVGQLAAEVKPLMVASTSYVLV